MDINAYSELDELLRQHFLDLSYHIGTEYIDKIKQLLSLTARNKIRIELDTITIVIEDYYRPEIDIPEPERYQLFIFVFDKNHSDNYDYLLLRSWTWYVSNPQGTDGWHEDGYDIIKHTDKGIEVQVEACRYLREQFETDLEKMISTECDTIHSTGWKGIQNIKQEITQYILKLKNEEIENIIDNLQ